MRVVSVNVGLPRDVVWRRRTVSTGIFKEPVDGPVHVAGVNLAGDLQADLEVHGGPDKAVYAYRAEHYGPWQRELGRSLPWGMFGENLTVEGMPTEDHISIGDRLRVGTAEFQVTQPRLPCYKLGIRFADSGMVRRFHEAGRTGFYLRIIRDGDVAAGDPIEFLARDPNAVAISEITRLYQRDGVDAQVIRRLLAVQALPESWRAELEELLDQVTSTTGEQTKTVGPQGPRS